MNAVIYARYSSYNQNEQSIEGQLHDAYDFAARNDYTIVGEYIDRAQSGRTDNRTDFQRMMQDAPKGQFQIVIVWKLDRFARNRYDSAINKSRLKKYGIRVVSVKENITDAPEGIILEGLLESMAEYYSANLSQNILRGQRETIANGRYCGGTIPYGYMAVDGKLVENPATAPAIRYLFSEYASGTPMKQIIDELNRRGYRGAKGGLLTYSTFYRTLTNPIYIGKYRYKGELIEGIAEALIDMNTFEKVQRMVKANGRAPAANKAVVDYILQGKAFCGMCGSRMVGESGRSHMGNTYHYYACAAKKKKHTCSKKNEKKVSLEQYIVDQTLRYVLRQSRSREIAKAVVREYDKEFSSGSIAEFERSLRQLDQELNKLVDALIDAPKVAHARIYERMESLEAKKASLETDLAKLKIAAEMRITEVEVLSWLQTFCNGDPEDPSFCQKIVDVFINAVYLYDDRLVVFYNIKGGKQVTYTSMVEALDKQREEKGSDLNADGRPYEKPETVMVSGFSLALDSTRGLGLLNFLGHFFKNGGSLAS